MHNHQTVSVSIRIGLCTIALFVVGCAQVPTKEFTSYREAFNNARTAGEQVLLDYGVALKEDRRDRESRQPATVKKELTHGAPREFRSSDIAAEGQASGVVSARMGAWNVVARYNDVLTGLAEGKSGEELTAAADGLFQSLSSFPIADFAEPVGSFAPFMGVLRTLLAKAAQERSRQDFIELVEAGAPLIRGKFLKPLRDDAEAFYEVRKGLNDREFGRQRDALTDLGANFLMLAQQYKPTKELRSVTARAKAALDEFGLGDKMKVKETAKKVVTPLVVSQLDGIASTMEAKATGMRATQAELLAYYQMLTTYVNLVDEVGARLDALALAAQSASTSFPPVNDLVEVYIDLRQAYETYRTAQRSAL